MGLNARILVGADGARSTVRQILGIPFNTPKHTGIALRAYATKTTPPHSRSELELHLMSHLLPGYAWVFPIDSQSANIGLGIDAQAYRKRKRRLDDMFDRFFEEWSAKESNPAWTTPGKMKSYILPYGSQLPTLVTGRAALVGDAGSMVNPITGDGISYGMAAGNVLGEELAKGLATGADVEEALAAYELCVRQRFESHFKRNYRIKRMASRPFWINMAIRALSKNPQMMSRAVRILMEGVLTDSECGSG